MAVSVTLDSYNSTTSLIYFTITGTPTPDNVSVQQSLDGGVTWIDDIGSIISPRYVPFISAEGILRIKLLPNGELSNEITLDETNLVVTGLEGDRYLINNEIHISVLATLSVIYFKTIIINLTNNTTSTGLISYPNQSGVAELNIQSIIKSLFDYPDDALGYVINEQPTKTANKYKIQIFYNNGTADVLGFETLKTFIRGGKRTTETNQTISAGIITPTEKLPYWVGYETAEYYIDDLGILRKRLLAFIDSANIKEMRSKGCNQAYVKFLNQNGGYSNWLFESHNTNEGNTNEGSFVRNNKVDDLGNNADFKISVQSKVPKEFKQLILDLIVSPEIYIYGVRVRSGRNSMTYDDIKRSYNVSINFEVDNRFNPSLLWSN